MAFLEKLLLVTVPSLIGTSGRLTTRARNRSDSTFLFSPGGDESVPRREQKFFSRALSSEVLEM